LAAVIATDLNGYIIYWNRAAGNSTVGPRTKSKGRNVLDVLPSAESRAAAVSIFDRLTKGESWSGTFETRHKNGHRLLVDVTDSPIRDQQGKLTAIVGISNLVDETEKVPSSSARSSLEIFTRMLRGVRAIVRRVSTDRPDQLRGFAIAGQLYGLAVGARILLDLVIPFQLPFISFFPR
jgi:PAS domain S-box-containing protein